MSMKKILIYASFILLPIHYISAEESDNTICDVFVTKMMRGNEHRITLEQLDSNTNKRKPLGPHLSFTLPPTTTAFNFIKFAYLYNKPLCVKYISRVNDQITTNTILSIYDHSQ